jgi:hypothetical protein
MCSICDPIKSVKVKKRMKTKENAIAKFLDDECIMYEREYRVNFDCFDTKGGSKFAKVDFVIYKKDHIKVLEVDENQHRHGYELSCSNRRTNAILGCQMFDEHPRNIVIIRYNPDKFSLDNEKGKIPDRQRMEYLKDMILNYSPTESVEIHYMYYDMDEDLYPIVANDKEFHKTLKPCVKPMMKKKYLIN